MQSGALIAEAGRQILDPLIFGHEIPPTADGQQWGHTRSPTVAGASRAVPDRDRPANRESEAEDIVYFLSIRVRSDRTASAFYCVQPG